MKQFVLAPVPPAGRSSYDGDVLWLSTTTFFCLLHSLQTNHSFTKWNVSFWNPAINHSIDSQYINNVKEHNMWTTLSWNFFKFGNKSRSKMNWFNFGGQMSRSLWPSACLILVNAISKKCQEGISLFLAQTSAWTPFRIWVCTDMRVKLISGDIQCKAVILVELFLCLMTLHHNSDVTT